MACTGYILTKVSKCQVGALAVRFNKLITSVGYLTARENEVDLLTTKFYNLHIVSVKKFHQKSVCHKIEGVQLRFAEIQCLKVIQQNRHTLYFTKCSTTSSEAVRPTLPKMLLAAL